MQRYGVGAWDVLVVRSKKAAMAVCAFLIVFGLSATSVSSRRHNLLSGADSGGVFGGSWLRPRVRGAEPSHNSGSPFSGSVHTMEATPGGASGGADADVFPRSYGYYGGGSSASPAAASSRVRSHAPPAFVSSSSRQAGMRDASQNSGKFSSRSRQDNDVVVCPSGPQLLDHVQRQRQFGLPAFMDVPGVAAARSRRFSALQVRLCCRLSSR
eukprot:GHVU01012014.1.p1 GENE.GHVU01012014.1~~GHVU01012014.1.p1  ORF type:complete len:212 (-),score=11.06 GHVU01012014.1:728-1363(-)